MTTISFTGNRPNKLAGGYKIPNPTYNYICRQIEKQLFELKPDKVITGGALGVDQWAAYIAYKLNIPFVVAVPFLNQESAWPKPSQKIYHKLLSLAKEVIIVSSGEYSPENMQIRNIWMVDNSDLLIAVWNKSPGGTANCVNYAQSVNKKIIFINPLDLDR